MVRPRDRQEARSAVINIRVTPELKERLEAQAGQRGVTISKECEVRLTESMEVGDERTRELLSAIAKEIDELEMFVGAKWYESPVSWSAVREMLNGGPIVERRPHDLALAVEIRSLVESVEEAEESKERLRLIIQERLGINTPQDPWSLANALVRLASPSNEPPLRDSLRKALRALAAEEGTDVGELETLADKMEEYDKAAWAARASLRDKVRTLTDAIVKGRSFVTNPPPDVELAEADKRATSLRRRRLSESLSALFEGGKTDNDAG